VVHGKRGGREAHVGSQSAGTIKLNFINWILRSVRCDGSSGKPLTINRRADNFSNDRRDVFVRAAAAGRVYQTGPDIALSASS
jgi:hypothetical protein